MASKLKYLLTLPLTHLLKAELEKPEPDAAVAARCLALGADPMARLNDGSSVFFALALKRPLSDAMEAWFKAVDGQLQHWPWRNQPTPLDDVLPYQGVTAQPEGYSMTLLKDLHHAGLNIASLDTPEHSLVDRVYHTYPQEAASVMELLRHWYPEHTFHATPNQRAQLEGEGFLLHWLDGKAASTARFKPR